MNYTLKQELDFKETLKKAFEKAQHAVPALTADTMPLSLGSFGLVVDHGDGSVSKLFQKYADPKAQANNQRFYDHEIDMLSLLDGQPFGNVSVPKLLDITPIDNSEGYFASYRMTKIDGRQPNWFKIGQLPEHHFRSVGALLASIHGDARLMSSGLTAPRHVLGGIDEVPQVADMDKETARALRICNAYMQPRLEPGIVHGDIHHGNMFIGPDHEVTGVIDFSFSGLSPNRLMDFGNIPASGLRHVIEAYESRGGVPVDPIMMTMTNIGRSAARLNWFADHPEEKGDTGWIYRNLAENLNRVKNITGQTFPVPP
jgi:hypothetical protein